MKLYAQSNTGTITVAITEALSIFMKSGLEDSAQTKVEIYNPTKTITPRIAKICFTFFIRIPFKTKFLLHLIL